MKQQILNSLYLSRYDLANEMKSEDLKSHQLDNPCDKNLAAGRSRGIERSLKEIDKVISLVIEI